MQQTRTVLQIVGPNHLGLLPSEGRTIRGVTLNSPRGPGSEDPPKVGVERSASCGDALRGPRRKLSVCVCVCVCVCVFVCVCEREALSAAAQLLSCSAAQLLSCGCTGGRVPLQVFMQRVPPHHHSPRSKYRTPFRFLAVITSDCCSAADRWCAPQVFMHGCHHSGEWITAMGAVYFFEQLVIGAPPRGVQGHHAQDSLCLPHRLSPPWGAVGTSSNSS